MLYRSKGRVLYALTESVPKPRRFPKVLEPIPDLPPTPANPAGPNRRVPGDGRLWACNPFAVWNHLQLGHWSTFSWPELIDAWTNAYGAP